MVSILRKHEIEALVINDTTAPIKPDAIFPNNWFNTTKKGIINVFPMFAVSRRAEKRDDILHSLSAKYVVNDVLDWTEFEADDMFLEGTGSLVIDHKNAVLYACYLPEPMHLLLKNLLKQTIIKPFILQQ